MYTNFTRKSFSSSSIILDFIAFLVGEIEDAFT